MTEQDEQERRDRWNALGIRTDSPYPARVCNDPVVVLRAGSLMAGNQAAMVVQAGRT